MSRLILASTSPYRRALLERLAVPFDVQSPHCDEDEAKTLALAPRELARRLAREKAESVRAANPGATIIGSDQVVSLDGEPLGKPGDRTRNAEQLRRLSDRTHELITAMVVLRGDELREHVDVTQLTLRRLSEDHIQRVLDADEPWDCAGGYKIEGRGISLFARVETADPTAIEGLPLMALTGALLDLGFAVPGEGAAARGSGPGSGGLI